MPKPQLIVCLDVVTNKVIDLVINNRPTIYFNLVRKFYF